VSAAHRVLSASGDGQPDLAGPGGCEEKTKGFAEAVMHGERDGGRVSRLAPTYLPREPHATVLYRLVKEHGAEFLRHARESYDGPLPRYVEDELRGYLRCGDFSRGFVHLRCHRCEHDLLVPFSCKNRVWVADDEDLKVGVPPTDLVVCAELA
jgi:hypothetical protein